MYAHNIISWHKDEAITPEQAFEFGKEFVEKWFDEFQTLMAVHMDRDHVHLHMVTNTVSYLDGHKLHTTKNELQEMKNLTNQMCESRGWKIPEKGKDYHGNRLEMGHVSAWNKDKYHLLLNNAKDSYVAACGVAVMEAKAEACSKEEFVQSMKQKGWHVIWKESRKNITFVNEEGKRVRDRTIFKTFNMNITKGDLLNEFNGNYERRKGSKDRTVGKSKSVREDLARKTETVRKNRRKTGRGGASKLELG